eukprot:3181051-Amphidinium_carterae.2
MSKVGLAGYFAQCAMPQAGALHIATAYDRSTLLDFAKASNVRVHQKKRSQGVSLFGYPLPNWGLHGVTKNKI